MAHLLKCSQLCCEWGFHACLQCRNLCHLVLISGRCGTRPEQCFFCSLLARLSFYMRWRMANDDKYLIWKMLQFNFFSLSFCITFSDGIRSQYNLHTRKDTFSTQQEAATDFLGELFCLEYHSKQVYKVVMNSVIIFPLLFMSTEMTYYTSLSQKYGRKRRKNEWVSGYNYFDFKGVKLAK